MRKLTLALFLFLSSAPLSAAPGIPSLEFFRSKQWAVGQHFVKSNFEGCYIARIDEPQTTRIEIERSISGKDFLYVFFVEKLIGENETNVSGKIWFDDKTTFDFSNVTAFNSTSVIGGKYVKINLGKALFHKTSTADVIEVEFSKGRTRQNLVGAGEAMSKFDACMDDALTKIFELPPEPLPYPTPLNWFEGVAANGNGGRYIATQLPKVDKQPDLYFAYVQIDRMNYEIRMRPLDDRAGLALRLDATDSRVKKRDAKFFFGEKTFIPKAAFAAKTLQHENGAIDIFGIDSMQMFFFESPFRKLKIVFDEPSPPNERIFTLNWEAKLGVGAIRDNRTPVVPVPLAPANPIREGDIVGSYYVRGKNPNGSYYYGEVEIKLERLFELQFTWKWPNGKSETAMVVKTDQQLTVVSTGPSLGGSYTIGKDGNLRGTFDKGKGSEILIRKF